MSTVVLARKYRPRSFAQMAGQEHVVRALGNALSQKRLHHAYLFTGTRGIGKTTVSRILAKSLNCTGVDGLGDITAEPCGRCSACVEIDNDRFIDYIEMDAASNRGIDEVRDMIERAAYKPSVGRFKVFMIDEAHQLTKEAFNALLKTLEEPPDYLKFVLATTDPEKMLPTVLSRCLQFNLRPMAPETVRQHLAHVLAAEAVAHDEGSLHLLSRAARGSMRDGLSLTDQAIAYGGGQFDEALVRSMLGLADANVAHELLAGLARRDAVQVLALVQQMRESGVACDTTLEQMALLLQQAAVEQAVPGALGLEHTDAPAARDLAAALTPEEVQLLYSLLVQGRPELSLLSDVSAAFSMVLLRYLAFPAVPSVAASSPRSAPLRAEPLARARVLVPAAIVAAPAPAEPVIPRVAANSSSNITAPASLQPTPLAAEAVPRSTVSPQQTANLMPPDVAWDAELGQSWDACVRRMADRGQLSGLVRELAWQSAPRLAAGGAALGWVLVTAHEALRAEHLRDKLAAALAELEGQPVALQIEPGTPQGTPAQRDAAQRARRQHEAELSIQQDPVVRELLSQFKGARVVPGSIKPL